MPLIRLADTTVPPSSEITPRAVWQDRRRFLAQLGTPASLLAGAGLGLALPGSARAQPAGTVAPGKLQRLASTRSNAAGAIVGAEKVTRYEDVAGYNNFYEFSTDKQMPAHLASTLKPRPWTVRVEGEVHKPATFDLDALLRLAPMEERIYRHRCVEGWSMVIPWVGFPLAEILRRVEPTGNAKFVQFFSLADKAQMPGLDSGGLDWPYTEGLRLDEAMHPLTLMAMGLYGEVLPNQNGAPIRLVVPWKYGFKGAKSIVRIRLVERQPVSSWERAGPREYGFYSNVNPTVDHPRWSQASERRIGDDGGLFAKRRPTLMFNGYEPQVGPLYSGMDLRRYF